MPELPEVETVKRGLAPLISGKTIEKIMARREGLRFPFEKNFQTSLKNKKILGISRRAKYLIFQLEEEMALVAHLGMTGSFRVEAPDFLAASAKLHHKTTLNRQHDHVILDLLSGEKLIYNDPRRFGFMFLSRQSGLETHPRLQNLGLEPLDAALDGQMLGRIFANCRSPLKQALLNQHLIAGLGNIYVCEALYRAGLSPLRRADSLSLEDRESFNKAQKLAEEIHHVLTEAIQAGGSTLRNFINAKGAPGYFQHNFKVYDKEGAPCPTPACAGAILRIQQSGRSTFYCPICQK